jgi:hypothetical protein
MGETIGQLADCNLKKSFFWKRKAGVSKIRVNPRLEPWPTMTLVPLVAQNTYKAE